MPVPAAVVKSARVPFLVLTPAVLLLALAIGLYAGAGLQPVYVAVALLAAISAHISVNALNEYSDFHSGLDDMTLRTPFSGGSGALPAEPKAAAAVGALGVVTLLLTIGGGLWLVWQRGWGLLPLGLAGALLIVTYTRWLNRSPWPCLLAPGLAFGPLMVVGGSWVVSGHFQPLALWLSLLPFALSNNLLLLNQWPDREPDRLVGRRHLAIVYGLKMVLWVYGLQWLLALLVLVSALLVMQVTGWGWLVLLPMAGGLFALQGMARKAESSASLAPYLAANVVTAVLTPALLGVALLV
ncbi:prenyltransferase [Pseudomaricurvus sp. HS19]|uniref:prenyltransferase n=1 Tax=Pseudomaricurvus sp. HS19 TaxID=2692626 RepID=UPI0013689AEE|nr:prenyltransferase [Pseudomaricurvus sp. HS19]MYM63539.1 prenyltransferase [Pseudomaricurvus sp. HS19]